METVRKIDLILQAALAATCLVVLPISILYTMLGELVLGGWQVLSALLNTLPMLRSPFRNRIIVYWVFTLIALLMLVPGNESLLMASMIGSWGIAIFYWVIYKSFIEHLTYRKELDSLIRH
ncbi:MAG TPA: hypothetical protein VD993_18435 [Chitinophagaceae bacterium]|nr:hypothetical protein [Chitinophagaceae bacterium]